MNRSEGPDRLPAPTPEAALVRAHKVEASINSVVLGKEEVVRAALLCLTTGGHLLLEDGPGVGKTLLARTIAAHTGCTYARIQGTSDLLPSDLTGVEVYSSTREDWDFHPGPIFASLVLVDELNRIPPRTQSALLEVMAEGAVTVAGTTHTLPGSQMVVGTQNPEDWLGTSPLSLSQRDRFMASATLGGPTDQALRHLAAQGHHGTTAIPEVEHLSVDDLTSLQHSAHTTGAASPVLDYLVRLWSHLRDIAPAAGSSARPALHTIGFARATAFWGGRSYVIPEDVQYAARACLPHRLVDQDHRLDEARFIVDNAILSTPVET